MTDRSRELDPAPARPHPARVPRRGRAHAAGARGADRPARRGPDPEARRHAGRRGRRQPARPRPAEVRRGPQLDDRGARLLDPAPPRPEDEHRRRPRRVLAGGQRHHVRLQAPEGRRVAPRARPRGRRREVLVRADARREDRVALALQLVDHRPHRGARPVHRALRHQAAVRPLLLLPGHAPLRGHRAARHRGEERRPPEGRLRDRALRARAVRPGQHGRPQAQPELLRVRASPTSTGSSTGSSRTRRRRLAALRAGTVHYLWSVDPLIDRQLQGAAGVEPPRAGRLLRPARHGLQPDEAARSPRWRSGGRSAWASTGARSSRASCGATARSRTKIPPCDAPFGYNGDDKGLPYYAHDPALARRLLTEAGFANGLDTTLEVSPRFPRPCGPARS